MNIRSAIRNRNKVTIVLSILLLLSLSANVVLLVKNPNFKQKMSDITDKKSYLEKLSNLENHSISSSVGTYDVLCIGNSITKHSICDFWWSESGMAASSTKKDYVHLLRNGLENRFENVNVNAVNFSNWERTYWDRFQTLGEMDKFLDADLDLIVLQLGDNIVEYASLSADLSELLNYLKSKCANAEIVVIGSFYNRPSVDLIKLDICISLGINYISLDSIQSDQYRAKLNDVVYDDEGNPHTISHSGTIMHPNDKAFEFIASKILSLIN